MPTSTVLFFALVCVIFNRYILVFYQFVANSWSPLLFTFCFRLLFVSEKSMSKIGSFGGTCLWFDYFTKTTISTLHYYPFYNIPAWSLSNLQNTRNNVRASYIFIFPKETFIVHSGPIFQKSIESMGQWLGSEHGTVIPHSSLLFWMSFHITFVGFVLTSKVHKLISVFMKNQAMIQNGIGPLCTSKLPPPSSTAIMYCLFFRLN